jgi:hypothetical protein
MEEKRSQREFDNKTLRSVGYSNNISALTISRSPA